jgi:hypothetical protein
MSEFQEYFISVVVSVAELCLRMEEWQWERRQTENSVEGAK